ncbi:FAD-dependent oxidoreductase [Pseudarthrobacter sp. J75]|uniref:ferredoxin--NADP reductase n=1 Tax=unclassified Pseudarthrobacter TaxID=2647000 RepID=UPI002E81CD01|nr:MULTISPECIES: FAD-dependent oxidoreductase [unclassified Pseudarthrobacter]MEE2521450.1 FAD-dependent oxidoreductase [Pseudarthrobacter sp. J47]MEE2528682.1 FAD-dependent oxidoreductase [Pseudarthrobacter sp. J75]
MSETGALSAVHRPALKARLDTALGKFTQYRLILLVLAVLAVYSLVLNVLGWLTFGLPEMLAHLALCVGLSYLSNRVLAAVFRVQPHSESSLITGLLLYFLFWPTFAPLDLAGVAIACVLATASKYALAWRGRHIFNPAAAGAFLAGLTGLNIATWWAATPAMLWLLVPGVLLVVYRTGKWVLAGTFTAVAAFFITWQLVDAGLSAGAGLWQALAQRPVLFFVGFMLTEPLTLPPRRWQQLVVAAVVGLAFVSHYNLGLFANSPEAALLLGNLLAFLVGQRGGVRLRFTDARPLTPSSTEFSFRALRPVRFKPGQFLELDLPHRDRDGKGRRRVFSLSSPPGSRRVTIGVETSPPVSAAKAALLALEPGQVVTATSVGGDFVPPRNSSAPVLLIAAGIGITPFMSHLAARQESDGDTALLYLAKNASELAYASELGALGIRVVALTADGSAPPSFMEDASKVLRETGSGRMTGKALQALFPDIAERHVYISGSPRSVSSLRSAAREAGARRVHKDVFAGY